MGSIVVRATFSPTAALLQLLVVCLARQASLRANSSPARRSSTSILTLWDAQAASNRAQPRHLTASSCTAKAYLRLALGLPRLRLAPAARWPVGLRTARWIAATPFLKHAGHAHGNVGDLTSASSAILASPRQASEL